MKIAWKFGEYGDVYEADGAVRIGRHGSPYVLHAWANVASFHCYRDLNWEFADECKAEKSD